MRKYEAEIDKLKQSEDCNLDCVLQQWTVPNSAFITFEHDDAKELALRLAKKFTKEQNKPQLTMKQGEHDSLINDFTLIGDHFFNEEHVHDAPDPTDIIWENRHWTETQIHFRQLIAFTICIGLLVGSFFILLATSRGQITFAATFPHINCPNLVKQYGEKLELYAY